MCEVGLGPEMRKGQVEEQDTLGKEVEERSTPGEVFENQ